MLFYIKKIISSILPVKFKDLLYSAIYSPFVTRLIRLRDSLIIKHRYNIKSLFNSENYLRLHLGCGNIKFPGFINIDSRKTKATDYVFDASRLPFPKECVELMEIYHMVEHLPKKVFEKALVNWNRILIPGGKLVIECPDFDNAVKEYMEGNFSRINNIFGLQRFKGDTHLWGYNPERLSRMLENNGFGAIKLSEPTDYHRLDEPCFRLEAYKINYLNYSGKISFRSLLNNSDQNNLKLLKFNVDSILIKVNLSDHSILISEETFPSKKDPDTLFVKSSLKNLPLRSNYATSVTIKNILVLLQSDLLKIFFSEIKKVLKQGAEIFIEVPFKLHSNNSLHQIFTKSLLAELFDESDITINEISLIESDQSFKRKILFSKIINDKPHVKNQNRKICAIGAFESLSYHQLGFQWDGQRRAFEELGYEILFLDIRKDRHFDNLREKIVSFKPELLWISLKDGLPFLQYIKNEIKDMDIKVVYHFCDLSGIEGTSTKIPIKKPIVDPEQIEDLIDYIFITNSGQINEYKKYFKTNNVFFMPHASSPVFHRKLDLPKKYDLTFTGSMDTNIFHKGRTNLLRKIRKKYNLEIRDNARNHVSELYSSSRIVLGLDVVSDNEEFQPYLYTSDRMFVAMSCGAFYLCQWFPGIEKIVKNHHHVVWFKSENELYELIEYFLHDAGKRESIGYNAAELANDKHTHKHRIQNMLDIIDGKTDKFYGYLNS